MEPETPAAATEIVEETSMTPRDINDTVTPMPTLPPAHVVAPEATASTHPSVKVATKSRAEHNRQEANERLAQLALRTAVMRGAFAVQVHHDTAKSGGVLYVYQDGPESIVIEEVSALYRIRHQTSLLVFEPLHLQIDIKRGVWRTVHERFAGEIFGTKISNFTAFADSSGLSEEAARFLVFDPTPEPPGMPRNVHYCHSVHEVSA